jgi:hypothetical protein
MVTDWGWDSDLAMVTEKDWDSGSARERGSASV